MPFDERVLTPRESMIVASGASPAFITVTAEGGLDVNALDRAMRLLADAHPILRTQIARTDGGRFVLRVIAGRPPLVLHEDGTTFSDVVGTPWRVGERASRLVVLREGRRCTIVLAIHHAVADGRLITALLQRLVEYYDALTRGVPVPVVHRDDLDPPLEEVLRRAGPPRAAPPPQTAPPPEIATLAPQSAPANGPVGFGFRNLPFDRETTARFIAAAKRHGLSVGSLVAGVMAASLRALHESGEPLVLALCLQVDLRGRLTPPIPPEAAMSAVGSVIINLPVPPGASPAEVGVQVDGEMEVAAERALHQARLLAAGRLDLPRTQEISVSISNLGRLAFPSTAGDLRFGTIRSVATMPFMRVPALVSNTTNGSLNLDLIYNRAFLTDELVRRLTREIENRMAAPAATGASSPV
ncbi:phthiocerol/phthiodiolone dimycocerosyl transferase family protein [Actinomadura macrotermitis]|uniref:Phthiocerol/phthiodiolone dimycocerosyl transferase n=1 Tax=Actinomadura macrotermitis TaxID=2585200 RepID=A0A7K0BUF6_9ACTN|nr:hypothetical protein [Actinomadura macrotermitis]MQY04666.1 hypothetical protein [Actinomadura macrotermitis]